MEYDGVVCIVSDGEYFRLQATVYKMGFEGEQFHSFYSFVKTTKTFCMKYSYEK